MAQRSWCRASACSTFGPILRCDRDHYVTVLSGASQGPARFTAERQPLPDWRCRLATSGTIDNVPELPEVEALAADLRERAVGREIDRADVAEFSVLKTYNPPLSALHGARISGTSRRGKFLDLRCAPASEGAELHLVAHLARAGWLRWRDSLPAGPVKPGKGPLAFRVRFTDGSGFDLTEAGPRKRLGLYLV